MANKPTTVAGYVRALDPERRKEFTVVRKLVKSQLPESREVLLYGMPHFVMGEPVCGLAAQKRYFALYMYTSKALDNHRSKFSNLDVGKSCIRFRKVGDLPAPALASLLRAARKEFQ